MLFPPLHLSVRKQQEWPASQEEGRELELWTGAMSTPIKCHKKKSRVGLKMVIRSANYCSDHQ